MKLRRFPIECLILAGFAGCSSGVYDTLDLSNAITVTPLFTATDLHIQVTQSTTLKFQITNTLSTAATLDQKPTFSGPFNFSGGQWPGADGTCGDTLESGQSCFVELKFSPTARGTASTSGTLQYRIEQQDKKSGSSALKLEAIGLGKIPGVIKASAASVSFGKTSAHSPYQYRDKAVTLTNDGDYTLVSLNFGGISSPFSPLGGCGASLEPGASCNLSLRFQPGAGSLTYGPTNVTITYNDGAPVSHDASFALALDGTRDDDAPVPASVSWNLTLDPAGVGGPPVLSSDSTPVLSGTTEPDALLSVYDGATDCSSDTGKLGSATADGSGNFSFSNISISTEKTYSFWFCIKDNVLNPAAGTDTTKTFQYVAKPLTPGNFRATASTPFSIALAWNDVSNEDTYELQSCSGSGCTNYADVGSCTAQNTTACAISNVAPPERNYRFRIRAVRSGLIASDWSVLDMTVPAYTVRFSATNYETKVTGAMVSATVQITRSDTSQNGHSARVTFSNGTGNVMDLLSTGTLDINFADGSATEVVTLPMKAGLTLDASKTLQITVSNASGNLSPIAPSTATLTVRPYTVQLSASSYAFTEGGTNQVTVTRSDTLGGAATATLTFTSGTADVNTDLSNTTAAVSFDAAEVSKTIDIPIVDDAALEGSENFTITLSTATTNLAVKTPSTATGTIATSDGGLLFSRTLFDALAGDSYAELKVMRTGSLQGTASAQIKFQSDSAIEEVDFDHTAQIVEFLPNQDSQIIKVPLAKTRGDVRYNRSFIAQISDVQGDLLGSPAESRVRIILARDSATGEALDPIAACDQATLPFGGGSGTPEDPYRICTNEQLSNILKKSPGRTTEHSYILTRDLDLGYSTLREPILKGFKGVFDGGEFFLYKHPADRTLGTQPRLRFCPRPGYEPRDFELFTR